MNSILCKPFSYVMFFTQFSYMVLAQPMYAETTAEEAHFTLSGIDGSESFDENVCPGFTLCFDIFSFGGSQTAKTEMFWDNGIPTAAFMVSNDDMPTGHFCWTPSASDARHTPYVFHVTMKTATEEKMYTYSITVPLLRAEVKTTDVSCFGNSDGRALAVVSGGSGNYTYQWSRKGEQEDHLEGLSEGMYTVEVMDDFGCEAAASARILSPKPLVLDAMAQHVMGMTDNGEAEVIANGGTMPYTYSWLPGEGSTDKIDHLPSGVYTAVVVDANGCTAYKQVNISSVLPSEANEKNSMVASENDLQHVLIYPNPTHDVFTVKNISESTVTVSVLNSLGQNVYNTVNIPANLSASISMDEQANGIYLVKVQQHSTIEMVKLIKE